MKTKKAMKCRVVVLACVLALLSTNAPRCLATESADRMVVDAVLVRPACLISTLVGSVFFVISLPIAATSKSVHRAARELVAKPAAATFTRPLGDLDDLSLY